MSALDVEIARAFRGHQAAKRQDVERKAPKGQSMATRADGRLTDYFMGELGAGAIDDEELALLDSRVTEARRRRDELAAGAWKTTPLAPATETTKAVNTDALPDPLDVDAARARRDAFTRDAWKVPTKRKSGGP